MPAAISEKDILRYEESRDPGKRHPVEQKSGAVLTMFHNGEYASVQESCTMTTIQKGNVGAEK